MKKISEKIGLGTLSLLLSVIGVMFIFSFKNNLSIGDRILTFIGLKTWSANGKGTHYTAFYSLIFFIPSVVLAFMHKKDIGAKVGGFIALILILLLLFVVTFLMPKGSFFNLY